MVEEGKKCGEGCGEECGECKGCLEDFKKFYSELAEKNQLPSFNVMNEDFNIEKMSETESDLPVREIRRFVSDKIRNYERFIEAIINPSNANMFIFTIIKVISADDKERLSDIYKKLMKSEVDLIELDVQYDEAKELKFVNTFFKEWQGMKPVLLEILGKINSDWDKEVEKGSNGYFG